MDAASRIILSAMYWCAVAAALAAIWHNNVAVGVAAVALAVSAFPRPIK